MRKKLTSFALVSAMIAGSTVSSLALEESNSSITKSTLKKINLEKKKILSQNEDLKKNMSANEIKLDQTKNDLQTVLAQKLENEKELNSTEIRLGEELSNLKQQIVNYYMNSYSSNLSVLKELISSDNPSDFIITTSHLKYIVNDRDKKVDEVSKLLEKYKNLSKKISDNESKLVSLQNELIENQKQLENKSIKNEKALVNLNEEETKLKDILIVQEKEEAEIKKAILNASANKETNTSVSNKVETVTSSNNTSSSSNTSSLSNTSTEDNSNVNVEANTSTNMSTSSTALQKPVSSYRITSRFGMRIHPVTGMKKMHNGIDLASGKGTPIKSSQGGKVIISQYSSSYGNYVVVDHGNGLSTLYAHLDKRYVSVGDSVKCGQEIGTMGSTGMSTGPHLHFEVRVNGEKVNPELHISF